MTRFTGDYNLTIHNAHYVHSVVVVAVKVLHDLNRLGAFGRADEYLELIGNLVLLRLEIVDLYRQFNAGQLFYVGAQSYRLTNHVFFSFIRTNYRINRCAVV